MKVISVNIGVSQKIEWEGKEFRTGYFKKEVQSIFLSKAGVKNDVVLDTVNHGGADKAVYLFGYNHYSYWQKKYPEFNSAYGMFGENITIEYLDETLVKIGDSFQIGEALVQVTQPRQPCFKMGIKFNNQKIVKEFRLSHTPGIYVRVLKEGWVSKNDLLKQVSANNNAPTVLETFRLIYDANPDKEKLLQLVNNPHLAEKVKEYLINKVK